jgi:uncharacterized membrane protein/Mg-chelatase subunit ChlD
MISFAHPVALLLVIPALALTIAVWRVGYANLSPRRMRVALAVRLALLAALILGLAGLTIRVSQSRQATVFVTDLSASDAGQRSTMQSLLASAATSRPQSDVMGVVDTGRQPVVEQPASRVSGFDGFQSNVDPQYTNLESGLDLANAILPGGYRRRVVVVSDGQQNAGDALAAARLLRSQAVRVDVVPVRVPGGAEALVDSVDMPSQLRPHESFALTVSVRSTVSTTTGITIFRDRTLIGSVGQARLRPGENRFVFAQKPLAPGSYTYQVQITPALDTQPENNQGSAFTTVTGNPRVLVIAGDPHEAANVMASLRSTGIQADLKMPAQVTPTLGYLQRYAAVVIVDTAADVLGPDLMAQLVPYVRDLGHGLAVLGGQQAYSMGGYGQTPLEQALPVKMELPKRRDLPTTAVVLIIESLEEDTQINLSKEAGKGVVNLLTPQDQVAVDDTPFDGSPGWVVTLQHVTNKAAIDAAINRMAPGDPDSYAAYLQSAYNVLKHTNARIKHIILLGDGDAEDSTYQDLVQSIRAGGVTVSTVTTNGAGRNDFQTMQQIAQWGGGRNYRADDPAKIPQIFLREARTVARLGIVPGKFYPQELSANPMVRDMKSVAPLYGYLATTPKPAAESVLASKKLDPVLAAWQFGLGRSVAWTSDAAGLWTKDWLHAPGANRFWANIVSWILPASGAGHLFISTSSAQGQGHISVTLPASLGASPNVTARVLDPQLHTTMVELQPESPAVFGGAFQESAQGAYFVTVEAHGGGRGYAGQVGMDVPYSQEYRTTGDNMAFLQQLAAAGGGTVISSEQAAWANNLASVLADYDLAAWLLLLAILLLPIDIGVRRLVVSRKELAAILEALPPRKRSPPVAAEPVVAPLGALRARRAQRAATVPQTVGMSMARSSARPAGGMGRSRAATPQSVEAAVEPEAGVQESIAGKLLAAKKRRG